MTVALGIGCLQLGFGAAAGLHAAQLVLGGAVSTSLADVPNTVSRNRLAVGTAAVLSVAAAAVVALLRAQPWAMGLGVAALAFCAAMILAWGVRAGPVAFAPVLSLVFSLATPPRAAPAAAMVGWNAAGAAAYWAWAVLSSWALRRRYADLALVQALLSQARLLHARADLLTAPAQDAAERALRTWIQDEAELAERLQAARDFVFAAAPTPRSTRNTAILLRTIDVRDALLASRLDAELLGHDAAGRAVLGELAHTLRGMAASLESAAAALRDGGPPPAVESWTARETFFATSLPVHDARSRLMPALDGRLRNLGRDVDRIHALLRGQTEALPLNRAQLMRFVAVEGWPLRALLVQWSWESPVLRHALRSALALSAAYFIARALPWASHPHWLVLSVAVVLRGSLDQTLMRRNARVLGTAVGCIVVVLLAPVRAVPALDLIFLAAVGTAHAFVSRRYWLTAAAASVMALLLTHLVDPQAHMAVAERLADTVLGAALAWAFSYVLPSWERKRLPPSIDRLVSALSQYADQALTLSAQNPVRQRMARQRAYDALNFLAAVLQRTSAEPAAVRAPTREIIELLDRSQRFMAHLSIVRMMLINRASQLATRDTEQALQAARQALALEWTSARRPMTAEAAGGGELGDLPVLPPAQDAWPWLQRRLENLTQDAAAVRHAADAALGRARRS